MNLIVTESLRFLGLRVQDKVTGFNGIVSSIGFDLYGCIQAVVTPQVREDGKSEESRWYDVKRLKVLDSEPVMELPDFLKEPKISVAGGAEKSIPRGL
jgi:hypothetical protein